MAEPTFIHCHGMIKLMDGKIETLNFFDIPPELFEKLPGKVISLQSANHDWKVYSKKIIFFSSDKKGDNR